MRLSLTGTQVDWMMNTSLPRTESKISTDISLSLKVVISMLASAFHILRPHAYLEIFSASPGTELPETITMSSSETIACLSSASLTVKEIWNSVLDLPLYDISFL